MCVCPKISCYVDDEEEEEEEFPEEVGVTKVFLHKTYVAMS